MKIVAWNVAHAARESPMRPGGLEAISSLAADVLALNEYVHGDSRGGFVDALATLGLRNVLVSTRSGAQNQVLIASRLPLVRGDIAALYF